MHVMLWPQVINGALLPFILIFMLLLINNQDIMGDYTNGWGYNVLAGITIVFIILITLMMLTTTFLS